MKIIFVSIFGSGDYSDLCKEMSNNCEVTGQQNKHDAKILMYFPDCHENQRFSRKDKINFQ